MKQFVLRQPRLTGFAMVLAGFAVIALNVWFIIRGNFYYPKTLAAAGGLITGGSWIFVTGRIWLGGQPFPPDWWLIGAILSMLLGVGGGFSLMLLVGE